MQIKLVLAIVIIIVSCGSIDKIDDNKKRESWWLLNGDNKIIYRITDWEDFSRKIKSKETQYTDGYITNKYFINGLNNRTEVIREQIDTFAITTKKYDEYGNLTEIIVIMDGDTSIVQYENEIEHDGRLRASKLYSSDYDGVVGTIKIVYEGRYKSMYTNSTDSLGYNEYFKYDLDDKLLTYQKCKNDLCEIKNFEYDSKHRPLVTKAFQNGELIEKWSYQYSDKGYLENVTRWRAGHDEEKFVVEFE